MTTLIYELYDYYHLEGIMPYTWDDFERDYALEHVNRLTPEERLRGLPPEERLRGLPPEEILERLPVEEIEAYLARRGKQRKRRPH